MKEVNVQIKGITPLLMNSPKGMLEPEEPLKIKTAKRDRVKEAEKVVYRDKHGVLFVPSTAIKGTIIQASAYKKAGKYALRPIISGGMRIKEQEITLNETKYEIDLRTGVIQRARIVIARPRLDKWKLNFTIIYDEDLIPDPIIIKTVLIEAGKRVGILAFRPQKNGEFGMFEVTKFEAKK